MMMKMMKMMMVMMIMMMMTMMMMTTTMMILLPGPGKRWRSTETLLPVCHLCYSCLSPVVKQEEFG
jgi:hypothetical protein